MPIRVPVVVGLNVTDIVQLAPAANVPLHGVVPLPTAAKSPVVPIESDVLTLPVFLTVTVLPALVVPTACDANVSVAGVAVTVVGVPAPTPDSVTICGELVALSVIEIVPGSDPFAVGVNVTVTVQLVPICKRVPQLFIWL